MEGPGGLLLLRVSARAVRGFRNGLKRVSKGWSTVFVVVVSGFYCDLHGVGFGRCCSLYGL